MRRGWARCLLIDPRGESWMTSEFTWQPQGLAGTLGPGTRVAGYLLEEQVGAGGMAVVFRARDETLGRPVAIKLMAPALASDAVFRARFLRESRAVATVESPHIIPVYAAGDAGGVLYIATRFVGGGDLGMLVRRSGGALAPSLVATLITQIASALDAAHAAGLVHRDVKPANVLVESVPGRAPHTFLSDFGLSKSSLSATSGLSATGQFLGTPDYSPPEQIRGETVDGRADQYALACVSFALLAGAPPFRRADTIAILYAHLNDPVASLLTWRPELPAAIDRVLQRALAKAPADRYRTCGEFAAGLRDALAGRGAAAVSSVDPASGQGPGERGDARFIGRVDGPSSAPGPSRPVSKPSGSVSRAVSMPSGLATTQTQPNVAQGISDTVSGREAAHGPALSASPPPGRITARAGSRRRGSRPHSTGIIIGAVAAVVLVAGGIVAAMTLHGSSSGGQPTPLHSGSPVKVATFTVPDGDTVDDVQFSTDGKLLAAMGDANRDIYVWDAASRTYLRTLTGATGTMDMAISPDDDTLTAVAGTSILRWNLATGKRTVLRHGLKILTAAQGESWDMSSDGTTLALVSADHRKVSVQSVTTGSIIAVFALPGTPTIQGIQLDGDGRRLLVADTSGMAYVWDAGAMRVIATMRYPDKKYVQAPGTGNWLPPLLTPELSPDGGTVLIYSNSDGKAAAKLEDVATGANITPRDPRWPLDSNGDRVGPSSCDFGTDGRTCWSFSTDVPNSTGHPSVLIWDISTRSVLLTMPEPSGSDLYWPALGPDDSEIAYPGAEETNSTGEPNDGASQISLWEIPVS
jgi:serine/threonine protein kinase/WD40 repeat protein